MFSLAKTFFMPLAAGRTFINTGIRSMSTLSVDFLKNFAQNLKQEPLAFKELPPSGSGIAYTSDYKDIPISIRVNPEFPALPLYTVFARFSTEQNKRTLKALFSFDDLNQ